MNAVKQQLYTIRKWVWLMALGLLLGAVLGYGISSQKPVVFQAGAKVMFSRAADDSAGANAFYYQTQMVRSYAELINNQAVLDNLNRSLGYRVAGSQLSATPVANTLVLWIYAYDNNPRRAAAIANAALEAITAYLNELQDERFAVAENDLDERLAAVGKQIADVQGQIDRVESGASGEDADGASLQTLQNTLTFHQQVYANLLDRQAGLHSEKLHTRIQATLLQPASPPATAIPRQRPQTAFTYALVGLMAAGALALTIETIDDRIHTPEDVEQRLNLPVLGLTTSGGQGDLSTAALEAYRMLRANLDLADAEAPIHTLLVTDPGTGAGVSKGESAIAHNLALTYAQGGYKTVLFDLRQQHEEHSASVPSIEIGTLLDRTNPQRVPFPAWGNPPLLTVAACQDPKENDVEARLSPETLAGVLQMLKETGERVVIDAPGGLTGDGLVLAARSDATLLVITTGKTHYGPAQLLIEQLQRTGARLLGVVVSARRGWPYYSRYNDLLHYYRTGKKF